MRRLSYSGISTFQRCPKRYAYRYIDRRVPIQTSDALTIGLFVHDALEAGWQYFAAGHRAIGDLRGRMEAWCFENASRLDSVDAYRVAAMLSNYDPPDLDRWEVLGTEVPFEIKVRNPATGWPMHSHRLVGFVDCLLLDRETGERVVREIKTTSDDLLGFGPYWSRLAIDSQIGIYAQAFRASRVIYDVLKKPRHRPSQADTKAARERIRAARMNDELEPTEQDVLEQFGFRLRNMMAENPREWHSWREIVFDDQLKQQAQRDVYGSVQAIASAHRGNAFPRYSTACRGVYGVCKYLDVCTGRATLDDDSLFEEKGSR